MVFFKQIEGERVPRQHAVEGRHRHRRGREGVRRRRPQERGRLHGVAARSTRCRRLFVEKIEDSRSMDGLLSSTSRPARPRTTSSRGCGASCASGASATPARSIPAATGVLPLVVGRATRLAQFLSAQRQVVRGGHPASGSSTDTGDAQGRALGDAMRGPLPSRDAIDAALDAFRGTFLQQPPAFSAKKIDGKRSYKLARGAERRRATLEPPGLHPDLPSHRLPDPVSVTAHAIDIVSVDGDTRDASRGLLRRLLRPLAGARPRRAARRRRAPGRAAADAQRRLDACRRGRPRRDRTRSGPGRRARDSARARCCRGSRRSC